MRTPLAVPLAVGACFGALSTRLPLGDSDAFWHLRLGHDILASGLPRVDTYSWTVAGRPVSSDQWLGQVALAAADAWAGWTGVAALRAVAIAALVGLIVYAALRQRPGRPFVAVLAALPAIVLSRFVWTERPELLGLVCLAALVPLLRAARGGSDRALVAIPPLVTLWANVHGSFALGAVLAVLVLLEGALAEPRRRRRQLAAAAATAVATLLTPAGLGTWTAPGLHLLHPPREIQEWSVPDVTTLAGLVFAVCLAAVIVVAASARAQARREGLLLVPVLGVALIATRQLPLFAIVAAPFLAAHGDRAIARLAAGLGIPLRGRGGTAAPPGRRADVLVAAAGAVLLAAAVATGVAAPDLSGYPTGALADLRPGPGLFAQYDWGGYLIAAAPATPVFVDGRLTPYLPAVLAEYSTVLGAHEGWREIVRRRGVRQLLVRPVDPVAVRARDLGWPVRVATDTFVLIDVP